MADGNNNNEPGGPFTAAGLVQHLRPVVDGDGNNSNNEVVGRLTLNHQWYRSMRRWTDDELRQVIEAAEQCTVVRDLRLDVSRLKGRAAEVVPNILRKLKNVEWVVVEGGIFGERAAVDLVLRGIAKSESRIERLWIHDSVCDPDAFFEFCTCYHDSLQELFIRNRCACSDLLPAFASSVAVSWGVLGSLRHVILDFASSDGPAVARLFALVHKAPKVEALDVVIDMYSRKVLDDVALLCRCTNTMKRLRVHGRKAYRQLFDMYPVFDVGVSQPFSPSIREVQFLKCGFYAWGESEKKGKALERAAVALRHTEFLRFGSCCFPSFFKLMERLPRLRRLSIVSRDMYYCALPDYIVDDDENIKGEGGGVEEPVQEWDDDDESDSDLHRLLDNNDDLLRLCRVIRRQESALEDIELDLVQRRGASKARSSSLSYPAMSDLLQCCKGRLILNCVQLPWKSQQHVVGGIKNASVHLKDLRLRFHDCALGDTEYAKIIRAVRSHRTLVAFEIGVGTTHPTLESSIAAIYDLVNTSTTLQVLSLQGMGAEAPSILKRILPVLTNTNRTLRTLKLRNAEVAPDRWPDLLGRLKAMLQVNHVFSALEGCDLPVDDPVASQVRDLLELNGYGRRFWTVDDLFTKKIWATVLERISNDNNYQVLYKFLRAKPLGERPRVVGVKRSRRVDDDAD